MWQLENPITRRVELDFSHSEGLKISVAQLWNDDVQISNAIEYANWNNPLLQLIVCEGCGYIGCQPHGWVEIKRTSSLVLIMPAFTKINEACEVVYNEYLPPYYLLEKGAIYIEPQFYTSKLCEMANFPSFEMLPSLSTWDAAKLFQLESPDQILGHISTPIQLNQDAIIASSEGSFREQAKELISLVQHLLTDDKQPAKVRRVIGQDQIISLYLDIAGVPEWKALSYNGSRYSLYLEPGYVIE